MDRLDSADTLLFEGFRLDRSSGGLFRLDQADIAAPVALGSRALDLLGLLVERQGELVSKDAIMEAVWPGMVVEEGNLTVQISALRRILDQNREEGSCIQTVPGRGYRFIAPVTRVEPMAPPVSARTTVNGSGGSSAESGQPQDPGAPGQLGGTPSAPVSRARSRLWGSIMATVIAALFLVAGAAAWNWRSLWSGDTRAAPRLSIVVLPFANLSDDREQQYFADGVTDDLTTDLSRIAGMFVIGRNTAFTYRDKPADAKQVGRELGVRYVLEGSVQRSGSQLRITAWLVDAETGGHLWAERFDREKGDLFALQNEITGRIAAALSLELVSAEATRPTDHPEVLDYIFRGRAAFNKGPGRDSYGEAISLFERALALDPRSVEALTDLAGSLAYSVVNAVADAPAADLERAERLIAQAAAISPRSPLLHVAKAGWLKAQGRCEEAIPEYEMVLALNRNSVGTLANLGQCKIWTGSFDEGISLQQQVIRLSPRDPFNGNRYSAIGWAYLLQSRTDEAIVWLEKARSLSPGYPFPYARLAAAYALKGETERAAAELAEARKLARDGRYSSIARLKAVEYFGVPKVRALIEATYFAGLRKAGVPEE